MIPSNFRSQLLRYKDSFTSLLSFNVESPKRMQWTIEEAIQYLDSIQFSGDLKQVVQEARTYLIEAHTNATIFSNKLMKPDPKDKDLGAISTEDSFWYVEVVGTAEEAIKIILNGGR